MAGIQVQEHIPLAQFTMYKIGGPARFFIEAHNADEIREAVAYARGRQFQFIVLGAGSNMLVSDTGFDGMVIRITGGNVRIEEERLTADAGVIMARAVTESAKAGLTGFEWGIGVPGTIGGSVRGNAGCFGTEMKDVVESVDVFDASKTINYKLEARSCEFSYRNSIFKKQPQLIVLSATLKLTKGDPEAIQAEVRRITRERVKKQDIGTKSCGCIFKNVAWEKTMGKQDLLERFPELRQFENQPNVPSAFLIDRAGLKGARTEHASISERHANFFINEGNATPDEIQELITRAKSAVKEKYGIELEEEIQYVGFDWH